MTSTIECPRCGHKAEVQAEEPMRLADLGLFECPERCGLRSAHGRLLLRVCTEPFVDERGREWVRLRFQHPLTNVELFVHDIDPKGAAMLATTILTQVIL